MKTKSTEAKVRQHGPQKEKEQITIRVDTELLNAAKVLKKEDGTRLTDLVERGLILAITESNRQLSTWDKQVRFMVANTTKEQQTLIRGLLIAMFESLVVDLHGFTPEAEKLYELLKWFLESRNKSPNVAAALEHYSRYGKKSEAGE